MKVIQLIALFSLVAAALPGQTTPAPIMRFKTNIGDMDVVLYPDAAPLTVANFLRYVDKGAYASSIFHRSVSNFVIQGGGYQLVSGTPTPIPSDPAVANEYKISNTRGTIAMAKLDGDPNSATNQWFFNTVDNSGNLDSNNGGFTVFGKINSNAGLTIMDRIAALPTQNLGTGLDTVPYSGVSFVTVNNILYVPQASASAIQSAASLALTTDGLAPGEIVVLYGQNLGPAALTTLALDSQGKVAPFLGGTRVLFNGTPAPIIYTSSGQVSAVVPQNLAGRNSVSIVVEYLGAQSAGITQKVAVSNPAIFTLDSSGKGDSATVHLDGAAVNGARPASVGETLILYGQGYGDTSVSVPDGTIVSDVLPVPLTPVKLLIDGVEAPTLYAGGAGGIVSGVLQVNFKVPQLAAGSHEVQIQVGDRKSPAGVKLQTK